ncbi:MAG: ATP-binding protein [Mycobacteriales bacterium]
MELWRRLDLDPLPESVTRARAFVVRCCEDWRMDASRDTAALLVSELATNAVRHAGTPVTVWVARRPDRLVLSVQDQSPALPEPYPADPLDESGRGLALVEALADSWGERDVATGKIVWAEIALTEALSSITQRDFS